MNEPPSRLEVLPNEILLESLKYLDARDLYRACYDLNSRFHQLVQSCHQLCLTLSSSNYDETMDDEMFSPNISTLIVNKDAAVILGHFTNVRRLILHWLPDNVLEKLEVDILPQLEYLYIDSPELSNECFKFDFYEKIFTNGFPELKFCFLSKMDPKLTYIQWRPTPSLIVLKIGRVDLFVYKEILSTCPNLQVFELALVEQYERPTAIEPHTNLKTLVIKQVHNSMIVNTDSINMYLSCVPNLKRLSIHLRDCYTLEVEDLFGTDWLTSTIELHLSNLRRVDFDLTVYWNSEIREYTEIVFLRLEEQFQKMQKNRYQSRLIINRKNWEDPNSSHFLDDLYL
jgi:hypothetical protein